MESFLYVRENTENIGALYHRSQETNNKEQSDRKKTKIERNVQ